MKLTVIPRSLLFVLLVGLAPQGFAQPPLKELPLRFTGLGPIRLGMSQAQLKGLGFQPAEEESGSDGCVELDLRADAKIFVMLENDKVTRISSFDPSVTTEAGVKVGATENQVKKAYRGRVAVKPHEYDEKGHYLIVRFGRKYAIVFETDGARVTIVHAGLESAAQYVEGCL